MVLFIAFKKELEELRELAQGWRGRVYTAVWNNQKVSVKVAKSELLKDAIKREAEILKKLKGIKSFPQILLSGEDFLVYRFIEGERFGRLKLGEEARRRIYAQVLKSAYLLDSMGINRDEFANIDKNVLVDSSQRAYVIDFERGKFSTRPANVTQFIQLLLREGILGLEEAIELGKRYPTSREPVFNYILGKLK